MPNHTDLRLEDPLSISKKVENIVKQMPMDQAVQVFTYASALNDICMLYRAREIR